jgi:uncharacterized protein YigA (DUF484 family)
MALNADQVAEFLRQNPGFFENHVDILMNLQVPHPHGGRAVSISERQLIAVREKSKILEDKLRELIQFGEENDALSDKVHRFACRLIEAPSLDATLDTLYLDLLDHFAIPHVAVRLWAVAEEKPGHEGIRAGRRRDAPVRREDERALLRPARGLRKPGVVRRSRAAREIVRARGAARSTTFPSA